MAADIVFVMDSSRSIWKYDFFKEMAFVNALVDLFHVEPGKTQVAVLQYSEYVTIEFNLIDGTDATDVKLKVRRHTQCFLFSKRCMCILNQTPNAPSILQLDFNKSTINFEMQTF